MPGCASKRDELELAMILYSGTPEILNYYDNDLVLLRSAKSSWTNWFSWYPWIDFYTVHTDMVKKICF